MSGNGSSGSGLRVGFSGLLALLFIALKLTGYVHWSWFWVLSPLWGGFALIILVMACVFLYALASEVATSRRRRKAKARSKK